MGGEYIEQSKEVKFGGPHRVTKQAGGPSKPDFADVDGDGNKTESMKSAAKQKKGKVPGAIKRAAKKSAKSKANLKKGMEMLGEATLLRKRRIFGQKREFLRIKKDPRFGSYETRMKLLGWLGKMEKRSRFGFSETLYLMESINENSKAPLKREDLYKLVENNFKRKEDERRTGDLGKTMEELMGQYIVRNSKRQDGDGLGFDFIDSVEDDYRGCLIGVIAKGGVGKSRVLKQMGLYVGTAQGGRRMREGREIWGRRWKS